MPIQALDIDPRGYNDLVAQTEELARLLAGWHPPGSLIEIEARPEVLRGRVLGESVADPANPTRELAPVGTLIDDDLARRLSAARPAPGRVRIVAQRDPGGALIRIFGRLAELAVARLNRTPDKNFMAFLDLIGAQLLPPQPARVPLTFHLATGSPSDGFVPVRTQVAAPAESDQDEVIFETERNLTVNRSQMVAAVAHQPDADRCDDRTAQVSGASGAFAAFVADTPIEHILYLAHDGLFTLSEPKTITLTITSPGARQLATLPIEWSCWDGTAWQTLTTTVSTTDSELMISFTGQLNPAQLEINGRSAAWLRARLNRTLPDLADPAALAPPIERISVTAATTQSGLPPQQALTNLTTLDLNGTIYPFGERPRQGDAIYLLSDEAFARPGAEITISLTLANPNDQRTKPDVQTAPPVPVFSDDLQIGWEVWNGSAWQTVATSAGASDPVSLTRSGAVTFKLPDALAPATVGGVSGHWLRARILRGNFGRDSFFEPGTGTNPPILRLAVFSPPILETLRLGYTFRQSAPPLICLSYNDFSYADHTTAAAGQSSGFRPFTPSAEARPALYLGFDQPFANRPITLYSGVEPTPYDETIAKTQTATPPSVVWEYSTAVGWSNLNARDETRSFAESGLISFVGPPDLARRPALGQEHYWLRARWERGDFRAPPLLRCVLNNTVWASQTTTVQNEVLGPSDGSAGQVFRTLRAPVLPGERIEVRERELPPSERAAIVALVGEDAITPIPGVDGQIEGVWVRWSAVTDFHSSGPRDRHYMLDRITGQLRFGDGQRGMIPPAGGNAVRAAFYQSGGGAQGNRPAATATQLKTALPAIDSVTNNEVATGGADQETPERLRERGPGILRHGGRAVAAQDYEDLARAAAPDIARVLAITPQFNPLDLRWLNPTPVPGTTLNTAGDQDQATQRAVAAGQIGLIVVPHSDAPRPIPSLELINRVEEYILARCPAIVTPSDLWVAGPDWVQVSVSAVVVATSLAAAAQLEATLRTALQRFLHPLTGGNDGAGWAFGRRPHLSDLYALIEAIDGVDHVRTLSVGADPVIDGMPPDRRGRFLVHSGEHRITLALPGEGG